MSHLQGNQLDLHDPSAVDGQGISQPSTSPGKTNGRHSKRAEHPDRTLHLVTEEDGRTPPTCWERIRERKVCKWAISYLAFAWLALQLLDVLGEIWELSMPFQRTVTISLGLGFLPVFVIAWYHGERGRQRVSVIEATILALLAANSGLLMWVLQP